MKKSTVMTAAIIGGVAVSAALAQAPKQELSAVPVMYTFTLPKMEELPFGVKPFGAGDKAGCEVTYLVTGSGFVSMDGESVKIESVTSRDGKDMSRDNRGRTSWKFGAFPKVSDDGKFATFTIFVASETGMVMPKIKGSVNIQSAGKTETKRLTFKKSVKGAEQAAGPLTLSVAKDEDFGIQMKGDKSLVSEIKIEAGGESIRQVQSFSWGTGATYGFDEEPGTDEFTLVVTYFTDRTDTKVVIGQ